MELKDQEATDAVVVEIKQIIDTMWTTYNNITVYIRSHVAQFGISPNDAANLKDCGAGAKDIRSRLNDFLAQAPRDWNEEHLKACFEGFQHYTERAWLIANSWQTAATDEPASEPAIKSKDEIADASDAPNTAVAPAIQAIIVRPSTRKHANPSWLQSFLEWLRNMEAKLITSWATPHMPVNDPAWVKGQLVKSKPTPKVPTAPDYVFSPKQP